MAFAGPLNGAAAVSVQYLPGHTIESASVVLLGNDLVRFVEVLRLARRCRGIIMANFAGTLAVDSVGVLLAALGFLHPVWPR